jgi:hypothetical protein
MISLSVYKFLLTSIIYIYRISSVCVNQKHICDKIKDCQNGEDEENCPIDQHPCPANSRCEQLCITSAARREECACRVGYVLAPNGFK